jgi:tRNA(Ile)-lysidine synthase
VIRPLLDLERAALRAYLAALGETWREDASNADTRIARNRVRHELIPYLGSQFSPAVTAVLARAAALARDDEDFLHDRAIDLAPAIVLSEEHDILRIDAAALARAPRALSSRIVQQALERHAGSRAISFDHVDAVLALAAGAGAGAISLPGQEVVRTGNEISVRRVDREHASRSREGGTSFAFSLSIPGEVELTAQRLAIAAERLDPGGGAATWAARGSEVGIAAGELQLPLAIRGRRPGDRFHPLGAPGPRKLQDFFVDRKVRREDRDTVPLVVDGRDRIVWVVGQSVAQDFRVTDPARGVILLKVRHLGGVG